MFFKSFIYRLDQENVGINASKVQTRSSAAKKVNKNQKKITMTPISGGHNLKVENTARDISPNSSTNDTKANIVKSPKTVKASKVPKANAQHILSGIKVLKTESPIPSTEVAGQGNESEKSSTSIGSIELRLAEMTSPVKTAAEVRAEQNGKYINISFRILIVQNCAYTYFVFFPLFYVFRTTVDRNVDRWQ